MNLKPKLTVNGSIGLEATVGNTIYFFGNQNADLDLVQSCYPKFDFRRLNQVHGKELVKSTPYQVSADAHWTDEVNVALIILTADCMPVMVADSNKILAIHSGWRSTLLNIIGSSIDAVFGRSSELTLAIGPFIQKQSFEVGLDVAQSFQQIDPGLVFPHPSDHENKALVDLAMTAKLQAHSNDRRFKNLYISEVDTKSDLDWASYRRDKPQASRNISFVARIN